MLAVDRGKYCHESDPYMDRPRKIGYNVTISAPHMVKSHINCHDKKNRVSTGDNSRNQRLSRSK